LDTYILIRGARQLLTLHNRPGVRRGDLMNDLRLIEDWSVLIRNNEIAAVGPTRRLENLREARTAAVISAHGRVVLPGFVDPTLRLMMGSSSRLGRRPSVSRISQEASAVLRSALHHGTTRAEVKVGGASAAEELRSLKSTRRIDPGGEDFVRTWLIRPSTGGGAIDPIQARIPTFEYMKSKMRGGFLEVEAETETSELAADLFTAAARNELPAKLSWLGPPDNVLATLLSRFRIYTLTGLERLETSFIPKLTESQTMLVAGSQSALAANSGEMRIREFLDAGGSLALATGYDPARSPMFNMQMTIAWAVLRMNLTAEEAITAATVNAAYASGIGAKAGSLEYGKSADLLLLNLADYRDLPRQFGVNHVGMVIRAGTVVFNRIGWKAPRAG
jgi:imidazolonepropionase